jgi:hypothetical protein
MRTLTQHGDFETMRWSRTAVHPTAPTRWYGDGEKAEENVAVGIIRMRESMQQQTWAIRLTLADLL